VNERNDELDRILNSALAAYSAQEPRPGLEQRVIAGLRPVNKRYHWLRWAIPVPVLAGVLLMIVYWEKPAVAPPVSMPRQPSIAKSDVPAVVAKPARVRRTRRRPAKAPVFPSPTAPTPEERALAQLAGSNPQILQEVSLWQRRQSEPLTVEPIKIPPLTNGDLQEN
jgi:hypothetical protein